MLSRAAARVRRLAAPLRRRALLVQGDFAALGFAPRFAFAIAAFHAVQELGTDDAIVDCFRGVAGALEPGGWFAFDLFAPDAGRGRAFVTPLAASASSIRKRTGGVGRFWP